MKELFCIFLCGRRKGGGKAGWRKGEKCFLGGEDGEALVERGQMRGAHLVDKWLKMLLQNLR